ncbi:cellulose synthase like E1 [Euphorbia peplus]|nr:cellulose synthase like E1 [Euphorbia peplus]
MAKGKDMGMDKEERVNGLFERKQGRGRFCFRVLSSSIFVAIIHIWVYRILYMPSSGEKGRFVWLGMLMSELFFGFYWICTQSLRWNITFFYPSKHALSQRYEENLPGVDIFICTADPIIEPPIMVINTVLSVMAYNYPPQKLAVYLSDDGGSELTFYALLEASKFAEIWIPFCKKYNILPMSPQAYFDQLNDNVVDVTSPPPPQISLVKKQYEEMKERIESTVAKGSVSREIKDQHKGFSEWNNPNVTKKDHQPIVQIMIDGTAVDCDGNAMPTLVYLSREKRPEIPHNFKAGAMNALIRVSSVISNGPIILNLDCDMYANNSDTIRETLCFFMDEERGHEIAFVQYPQIFGNITNNDLYGNSFEVVCQLEQSGMGGHDAAAYLGTGCFHRRETLCGKKYSAANKLKLEVNSNNKRDGTSIDELEQASKLVASCSFEKDTLWGKEMGLVYGCAVEDMITGITIICRGWKSIFYYPERKAFLGLAPITLEVDLIQNNRWTEGLFQILTSKYCPFIYGHGKMTIGAQLAFAAYLLWPPLSLPTLYYVILLPISLLLDIPLFPQVRSPWLIPFTYVFISRNTYSIIEELVCGGSFQTWWNLQRMHIFRRTTAYLFGFIDSIKKQLGLSRSSFAVTPKVVTDDVLKRYEQEVMEFGSSNFMFIILATLAMLNLSSLVIWVVMNGFMDVELVITQVVLCGIMVALNLPVYQAMFFRSDDGRIPVDVVIKSAVLASVAIVFCLSIN